MYLEEVDDNEPEDGGRAGEEGDAGRGQAGQVALSLHSPNLFTSYRTLRNGLHTLQGNGKIRGQQTGKSGQQTEQSLPVNGKPVTRKRKNPRPVKGKICGQQTEKSAAIKRKNPGPVKGKCLGQVDLIWNSPNLRDGGQPSAIPNLSPYEIVKVTK